MIYMGGIHWDPHLIGWGQVGRPGKHDIGRKMMKGYWNKKEGRGKLSDDDRRKRTIDFWEIQAVYALFERGRCVYVGEGKLGDCLERHWKRDTLVGRWDAFTWLSPFDYELNAAGGATLRPADESLQIGMTAKSLIELLELVVIRLGSPEPNSQLPKSDETIKWMTQVDSATTLSRLDDKVDEVLKLLKQLSDDLSSR